MIREEKLKIRINNKEKEIEPKTSLSQLVKDIKAKLPGFLVELNGKVVGRDKYEDTILKDGDKVEIIPFVAGG